MVRSLGKEQLDLMLRIFGLVDSIVEKYEGGSYEAGVRGMIVGLRKYMENDRWDTKLDLYLVWYIKTAIEFELGRKNKDTRAWKEMLKDAHV